MTSKSNDIENKKESLEVIEDSEKYTENFSDEGFWDKVTGYAKKAGKKVIEPSLKMYYAAQDPETPTWAKGVIYGALGYFIFPVDAIPDVAPVVGYTDDFSVLAAALATIATNIKDEHVEQAKEKMKAWFK
ncbi:YkvA family protein [Avibacterium avium]|uniref:YkvA family protein n=1 Tax=Avibacterium avium TaxID=751 RepID=UPI003BF812B5